MTAIDKRIVDMSFNNKQFEAGIAESSRSLEKLKTNLDLSGAAKGFSELEKASKNVSLSSISESVDRIADKFSMMSIVGITAITNLTNSAVEMGKRLLKSLSVDQISAGWSKYAQKTASVQTIMNATGLSIDEVNQHLDKLMWFSDETSYGFTDMTAALGQMTSTGGDINKLIPLITGVANATAYAGKGAQEFSRAMYNLNQSYGAGSLQYMDWKSLELAGIASKELKQIFIDTGVAMGKIKKGQVTIANFGQTLKDRWADTSVMEQAFGVFGEMTEKAYEMVQAGEVDTASEAYAILAEKYNGVSITAAKAAQEAKTFAEAIDATKDAVSSGWMKTFEIIFGNYVEAKELWTDLANGLWEVFASGADSRNEMMQEWKDIGGRADLISGVSSALSYLVTVLEPVKEAFSDIFPPMTGERLASITKSFKEFIEKLKPSERLLENIRRIFKGIFAAFDIGLMIVRAMADAFFYILEPLIPIAGHAVEAAAGLGDLVSSFRDSLKTSKLFTNIFSGVSKTIVIIIDYIKELVGEMDIFSSSTEGSFSLIQTMSDAIKKSFESMHSVMKVVFNLFKRMFTFALDLLSEIGRAVSNAFSSDRVSGATSILGSAGIVGIFLLLKGLIEKLKDLPGISSGFIESIKELFGTVQDSLESWQQTLKSKVIKTIATSILILAGALLILSMIDPVKLAYALGAVGVLLAEMFGALMIFEAVSGKGSFKGIMKVSGSLVLIATSMLILAGAVKILSTIAWEDLAKGLGGLIVMLAAVSVTAKYLSDSKGKLIKGAGGLIAFAIAIRILVDAVVKMGALSYDELVKGLIGVAAVIKALQIFINKANFDKFKPMNAIGLIFLAGAVNILAIAVEKFGQLSVKQLIKGLGTMGVVLAQLAIFINFTKDANKVLSTAIALNLVGTAMLILAKSLEMMGSMNHKQLLKGLFAMGGALTMITVAMNYMPKDSLKNSAALLIIATAIGLLAISLQALGNMSLKEIGASMIALGGALTIISLAMVAMNKSLTGAAALGVVSLAIIALAVGLKILSTISLVNIASSLFALAGVLVIFGVAATLLSPAIPALLGLAAATLLFGVAALAVGAGVLALSTGLLALATGGVAAATAIKVILMELISLLPFLFEMLGNAVIVFANVIANGAPAIINAIVQLGVALLDAIDILVPKVLSSLGTFLIALMEELARTVPKMVDAGMRLILGILKGIADNIQDVTIAGIEVILEFIRGVTAKLPDIIDTADKLIISFINGLAESIRVNAPAYRAATYNLIMAIINSMIGLFKDIFKLGADVVGEIIKGLNSMVTELIKTGKNIGKNMIQGVVDGVKGMAGSLLSAAKGVIDGAIGGVKKLLDINSPSGVGIEIGRFFDMGLIQGLSSMAKKVGNASKAVGQTAVDMMQDVIADVKDILDIEDYDPTIRPILDLDSVYKGLSSIQQDISGRELALGTSFDRAASISAGMSGYSKETKDTMASTNNTTYNITLDGVYHIREEADIKELSQALAFEIERKRRA